MALLSSFEIIAGIACFVVFLLEFCFVFRGGRELGFWNWQEKSGILLTAYGRKCHGNYFKMTEITLSRSRSHMAGSVVRSDEIFDCLRWCIGATKTSLAFRTT